MALIFSLVVVQSAIIFLIVRFLLGQQFNFSVIKFVVLITRILIVS